MAATISAVSTAPVLRAAAQVVAELPHRRVIRTDVHHALRNTAPTYDVAQAALDALTSYLRRSGGEQWLTVYAFPRSRDEVAAELCAAADSVDAANLLRTAADYIETYKLDRFNIVHVIRAAAVEVTPFGPEAFKLADAAMRALAARLYATDRDPVRDLTRWSRIRTRQEIVVELRAAGAR